MSSDLQTTPKEVILPTSQLLDLLNLVFPKENRKKINDHLYRNYRTYAKSLDIKGMVITYAGQPAGIGKQHQWKVNVANASEKLKQIFISYQRRSRSIVPVPPQDNQGQNATFEWNGLFFRSPAELKIAEALDAKNVLFFPNTRCRVSDRNQHPSTIEVDFLVVHQGKMGILEVDGATYHQGRAAEDHKRDRLFMRQGILCSRFTAADCLENAAAVVDEFLELFAY